jgi:hypothetical protein
MHPSSPPRMVREKTFVDNMHTPCPSPEPLQFDLSLDDIPCQRTVLTVFALERPERVMHMLRKSRLVLEGQINMHLKNTFPSGWTVRIQIDDDAGHSAFAAKMILENAGLEVLEEF